MNTAKIAAVAARLFAWAKRRSAERTTWLGLAGVAAAFGYSTQAQHLTSLADVIPMLVGGGSAMLAAASTSSRASAGQPQQPETAPPTA